MTNRAVTGVALPDVISESPSCALAGLDWVGMEGIALPLRLNQAAFSAMVNIGVNLLPDTAKGIHMSRLYLALQPLSHEELSPCVLEKLLRDVIRSHEGLSTNARIRLNFDYLVQRQALLSNNAGWQRYPVIVSANLHEHIFHVSLILDIPYASACPCSATLARQLNAAAFEQHFPQDTLFERERIVDWLRSENSVAGIPHAQRSVARVETSLAPGHTTLPIDFIVHRIETALATPVQTAVKREDEQQFAAVMANNLMFCEDACRRVQQAMRCIPVIEAYDIRVDHQESLHAHSAVARVHGKTDNSARDSWLSRDANRT